MFKVFLVGDAGEGDTTGLALLDLKTQLLNNPNSAVIFLGDNCYIKPYLLSLFEVGGYDGSSKAQNRIMSQLRILKEYNGSVFFIPGNHDWWNKTDINKSKYRLLQEQVFIEDTLKFYQGIQNKDNETFLPSNGSPGPISRVINNGKTRIIFIDTYRMIIEEWKKKKEDTLLIENFYSDLNDQLKEATNKSQKIIVVGHHPIMSKGKHSIPMTFFEKLSCRTASSNSNYAPYSRMALRIDCLLKTFNQKDIYYASGHEHSLEYFFNLGVHYMVSGSGSKIDKVNYQNSEKENEYLIWNEPGFFEIDFYDHKEKVIMYHRNKDKLDLQIKCLYGCD